MHAEMNSFRQKAQLGDSDGGLSDSDDGGQPPANKVRQAAGGINQSCLPLCSLLLTACAFGPWLTAACLHSTPPCAVRVYLLQVHGVHGVHGVGASL